MITLNPISKVAGSKRTDIYETLKEIHCLDKNVDGLIFYSKNWSDLYPAILSIRLALPFIGAKALLPVIIVSADSKEKLLEDGTSENQLKRKKYVEILLTPGIFVASEENLDKVKEEAARYYGKSEEEKIRNYRERFLEMIKVTSKEGSHSIANEWAAYVLGKLVNQENNRFDLPKSNDFLYLCYLLVSGMNGDVMAASSRKKQLHAIHRKGRKNVLLIDDQDDVWYPVLRKIFPPENINIHVWGKDEHTVCENHRFLDLENGLPTPTLVKDTDDYVSDILDNYDLVLLDMRLGGANEQTARVDELSGIKVLKQIMERNPGQRVVMFTSSNKSWNIKRAIQLGAQDIYIKESPQFVTDENQRIDDYNRLIDSINFALEYSWMKDVVSMSEELKSSLDEWANSDNYGIQGLFESAEDQQEFFNELAVQIEIATTYFISAIQIDSEEERKEQLRLAYLSLESTLERLRKLEESIENYEPGIATYIKVKNLISELLGNFDMNMDLFVEDSIKALITLRNTAVHGLKNPDEDPYNPYNKKLSAPYKFVYNCRHQNNGKYYDIRDETDSRIVEKEIYLSGINPAYAVGEIVYDDYVTAFRLHLTILYKIFVLPMKSNC